MPTRRERRVPRAERLPVDRAADDLDWHSLRLFLQLYRAGSFRACAASLEISVNSLRRRIEALKAALQLPLFIRTVDGIRPTAGGEHILAAAEAMEQAAFRVLRARGSVSNDIEGEVRIAVTEGLGTAWLTPRLVEFQNAFPNLRVALNCAMNSADVLRMEADIAVQLTRPEAADVKLVRLGYLHTMPFASRAYAARNGLPTNVDELIEHRLILQIAEQTSQLSIFGDMLPRFPYPPTVPITTNTSSALALAIANGAGIGWLPTYVSSLQTGLLPVDCGLNFRFDVWLTYHPEVEVIPRVRQTINWIKSSFDAGLYPFFGETYIHPADLPTVDRHIPLSELYKGFVP
ncbi:LysR family transcriptional regulator [Methylorubrum populi]|uniref:LysR family transcriptional regulator n=1 Tax=Methylorubrum populi TaxID=223967 RepID=UPI0031F7929A